jgi:hypothetical protein
MACPSKKSDIYYPSVLTLHRLATFSLPLLSNRKQLMAHALAQSQLTAEDEGEAEAGEVCGTKAVLSGNSPCNRFHVLSCPVLYTQVKRNCSCSVCLSLLSPSPLSPLCSHTQFSPPLSCTFLTLITPLPLLTTHDRRKR